MLAPPAGLRSGPDPETGLARDMCTVDGVEAALRTAPGVTGQATRPVQVTGMSGRLE